MILYNGQAIIPGPLVNMRREIVRDEAGYAIRQYYSIQAKGKLVAYKGSPNSLGIFWTDSYTPGPPDESIPDLSRLAAMRGKIQAMNNLFATQGQWFEIQPFDGTQSIKFQPVIKSINFAEGLWHETLEYTIDMEAATIYIGGAEQPLDTGLIPEESWSIEAADQIKRTYRLTHNVSSQQKNLYDNTGHVSTGNAGWQRAQAVVLPYLGLTDVTQFQASGVLGLTTWQPYNYFRGQQVDEGAGKFSVTETWLIYDAAQGGQTLLPPAIDDFTVNERLNDDGISSVTIEGTITGLESSNSTNFNVTATRWANAQAYFNNQIVPNVFNRASSYSNLLLNPIQLSSAIGRNPIQGTITYNGEYSNRRSYLIPGAIRENISIQGGGGTEVFASIPVPGRIWGPVLQDIETITERSFSINIDAQMQAGTMSAPIANPPNTDGIILGLAPVALQVFRGRDDFTWSPENGKYTRQVNFVYQ